MQFFLSYQNISDIRSKLSVTMENKEIFFTEIRNGNISKVKELASRNTNLIRIKDDRGSTPLILATYYNHIEISIFLLEHGALIDEKDETGNTALMGVCFKGYLKLALKLIAYGANVNERNAMGASPLIYAITFNRVAIAEMLLEHGADRSVKDSRGNTALDHAKLQGAGVLIDLLEKN